MPDANLLLQAYQQGLFSPCRERAGQARPCSGFQPRFRAILPLDGFHISRSLAQKPCGVANLTGPVLTWPLRAGRAGLPQPARNVINPPIYDVNSSAPRAGPTPFHREVLAR